MAAQLAGGHDTVTFVGTPHGLEARLVPEAGVPFLALDAAGFDRSRPWTLVTSSAQILASAVRAVSMLRRLEIDVVVGFGGYVSIPVGMAAALLGIPLVLHEQNSVPGMANRFLSRWAKRVGVTYPESVEMMAQPQRSVVTGNPVRAQVLQSSRQAGRRSLDLTEEETVVLVFGGSRGARHLNDAVVALKDRIEAAKGTRVVLVTGPSEYESVCDRLGAKGRPARSGAFTVFDYLSEMGSAISAADLVVARAGATSIAELTALGAPCILVPYPYATDDHQTKNAAAMVSHGAAVLVADSELDSSRFGDELLGLICDPVRRASMAAASRALGVSDAAARVAALVHSAVADSDSNR